MVRLAALRLRTRTHACSGWPSRRARTELKSQSPRPRAKVTAMRHRWGRNTPRTSGGLRARREGWPSPAWFGRRCIPGRETVRTGIGDRRVPGTEAGFTGKRDSPHRDTRQDSPGFEAEKLRQVREFIREFGPELSTLFPNLQPTTTRPVVVSLKGVEHGKREQQPPPRQRLAN